MLIAFLSIRLWKLSILSAFQFFPASGKNDLLGGLVVQGNSLVHLSFQVVRLHLLGGE